MKEVAIESLPNCFGIHGENIIPEFNYGKGRTDLVFVNISKDYWHHRTERLDLSKPIPNNKYLISFLQLHGSDPITKKYFFEKGAQPKYKKRNALEWLKKNNFVVKTDSGKIRTAQNLRRHVTTSIAVELKLDKWKDALRQASMGRSFAEYRYVAIDACHVEPAYENIGKFKSNNVGLISINESGKAKIHWRPDRGNPYSDFYQWKVNETSISEIEVY